MLPGWLVTWPGELVIPAAKGLSAAIAWISQAQITDGLAVKDVTRTLSSVIEWPTRMLEAILVDGFNSGFGSQAQSILPPLSWLGLVGATLLLAWRLGGVRLTVLAAFTAA